MIAQYFNTAAFVPLNSIPRGTYGNATRGLIYGPGDSTTDLAILRYVSLGPDMRLQLRGEFFNAFDQVNFNNPVTNISRRPRSGASPAPAPAASCRLRPS